MPRQPAFGALVAVVVLTAGCMGLGSGPGEPTATPPTGDVDFPHGPMDPPPRPQTLNESSVREFVLLHEYRYVYNVLSEGGDEAVSLDCGIDRTTEQPWGYEVVVTCSGTTDSGSDDWPTQSYRYQVSESGVNRTQVEGAEAGS